MLKWRDIMDAVCMHEMKDRKGNIRNISNPVQEIHCFVLKDGRRISSILDLVNQLGNVDEDTFRYHVNQYKNDFGKWIRDVFDYPELAEVIEKANSKTDMHIKMMGKIINDLI